MSTANNKKPDKIVQGISTSLLFDMREANAVYQLQGEAAYTRYMMDRADEPLPLGRHFDDLRHAFDAPEDMEVIILSRNSSLTARRAVLTMMDQGITPTQMLFTNGGSPCLYLRAYGVDVFKTSNAEDAKIAQAMGVFAPLQAGITQPFSNAVKLEAAKGVQLLPADTASMADLREMYEPGIKFHTVFDLDGVVFDQTSERFFQQCLQKGDREQAVLEYRRYEAERMNAALSQGPAFAYLRRQHEINQGRGIGQKPYRISVLTARGGEAAVRAIETLYSYGIEVNGEAHFMNGKSKQPVLEVIGKNARANNVACEFYDDQEKHIEAGRNVGVMSGHVLGFEGGPAGLQ
jgi:5'-nucleotidase